MTNGNKVITTYFILAYCVPLLGNFLFQEHIYSSYTIYPLNAYGLSQILSVYLLYLVFSKINFPPIYFPFFKIVSWIGKTYLRFRFIFAGLFCIFALANLYFGFALHAYRYTSLSISERDSPLLLLGILTNSIITADLLYSMFIRQKETIFFTKRYFENIFLSFILIITSHGTASAFLALFSLLYSFFPSIFEKFIFKKKEKWNLLSLIKSLFPFGMLAVILTVSWFYGESIKRSSVKEVESFYSYFPEHGLDKQFFENYFYYLIERFSIYYYSFTMTVESTTKVLHNVSIENIFFPLKTFLFRLDYLLGGVFGMTKPEVTSICHLNYQILVNGPAGLKEGSCPGLLGSFNYIFNFPLNILFCSFYLSWVSKILDILLIRHKTSILSGFGSILFLFYIQAFFASPIDLLILLDSYILELLIVLGFYIRQRSYLGERIHST